MKREIVVVGSINLDLVASSSRIPLAGETVAGSTFRTFPGGKGANQAVAAARLGRAVTILGKLGNDVFSVELRDSLEQAGVETGPVENVADSSGVALINTDAKGENAITVVPGANSHLSPVDIDANSELLHRAGIVLTQLEVPIETVEHLASFTRREGIPLMLDPAPARPLSPVLLSCVDWLTPNETETCVLLGRAERNLSQSELEDAANALLQRGCKNVILKLGRRGCYLALADGTRRAVPAHQVSTVDTTAAGDAFNGAFAVGLLSGRDPVNSAEWACAVATLSVTRHGAQPSMPTANELEDFLEAQSIGSKP
ncbi:MAG: ribokinase [Acidobacteriia bacterium]|nr:ribokinase [Terriglobia bacterium]